MSTQFDAIVIGGGHNGLTTATFLAKAGKKVLVLEKRAQLGGLASTEEFHPGYRSLGVHQDSSGVRKDIVAELGLERHGLQLASTRPHVYVPKENGPGFVLGGTPQEAAQSIRALSPKDADQYLKYQDFITRLRPFIDRLVNDVPPDLVNLNLGNIWSLMNTALSLRRLGKGDMLEFLRIGPMCAADWMNEWFESQPLKAAICGPGLFGTYMGPWSPTSNLNVLFWEAGAQTFVKGGSGALTTALEKAARSLGVQIRTEAEVAEICVEQGKVTGVKLASGEQLSARAVASSCDPRTTFLKWVNPRHLPQLFAGRVQNFRMRGTTAQLRFALNQPFRLKQWGNDQIEFARTGSDLDFVEKAFDGVKYDRMPERPVLDISVPSVSNAACAPQGHASVSVLANFVPYVCREGGAKGEWTAETRAKLKDTVVRELERYSPGFGKAVVGVEVLTPPDLEARYGIAGGHIHHGEHAPDQFFTRPSPEVAQYGSPVAGLFLCGSGAHPGGGLTCAPGALASKAVLKAL
ncbi:MAG: phytoene desaturase family protein [Bacteriovoracia bacterium]